MKKTVALAMALSFAALLAMVPSAHAKNGADNPPQPPQIEQEKVG